MMRRRPSGMCVLTDLTSVIALTQVALRRRHYPERTDCGTRAVHPARDTVRGAEISRAWGKNEERSCFMSKILEVVRNGPCILREVIGLSAIFFDGSACGALSALRFLLRLLPVRFILHWPCPFLLKPVAQLLLGRRARCTLHVARAGLQEMGCRPYVLDKLEQRSSLHMARADALFLRLPVEQTEFREMATLDRESGEELSKDLASGGCPRLNLPPRDLQPKIQRRERGRERTGVSYETGS